VVFVIVLGVEGTAHTFGVGIIKDNVILANARDIYSPKEGGIIPREAADHHNSCALSVIKEAILSARINANDIDLVSFSQGPGLGPCLRTAAVAARSLALVLNKPVIGVNHCVAHVEIAKLATGFRDPVLLYVSGGSTQILALEEGRYRIFGETLDISIGNCLDVFARMAGLKYPGGPEIERLARQSANFIPLPYVVKGMDFSFSGILTNAIEKLPDHTKEDLSYSLQEHTFAMLTEAVERALAHTEKGECLLTGGVAANKRLQEMLGIMCNERDCKFQTVPREYAGDNGAMIAHLGHLMHQAGVRQTLEQTRIRQRFRTDDVEVSWARFFNNGLSGTLPV